MQKQDKAFSAWLNHLLVPATQERMGGGGAGGHDEAGGGGGAGAGGAGALNDRRLAAVMQGALVACYRWACGSLAEAGGCVPLQQTGGAEPPRAAAARSLAADPFFPARSPLLAPSGATRRCGTR
jgi:hypothetical protein